MQNENVSFDALTTTTSAAAPLYFSRSNPFLSPTSPSYLNSSASFYSSLFQNYSPNSISDTASFDGGDTERRLHDASCILEYQQLYNRYTLCLGSFTILSRRLTLSAARMTLSASPTPICRTAWPCSSPAIGFSPNSTVSTSLLPPLPFRFPFMWPLLNLLLNTIALSGSIPRESHFQRAFRGQKGRRSAGIRCVQQGMFKTELCNKWQETGTCPYGENCQFAHGIKELRPVIRHPRYKTEVCRMVLAGDICPYGHRCHFRHSLTEQERLLAVPPPPLPG
ncbi:UNVERIFIED_CONTAM: Zinc finger CCCH domain-containing protein 15 [Sesamum calycinum]|uniref:Zinc finger CCCH domain-containing protein 15 n=1 Tax=Sesamum calycinum TaxID=2727403 RepID=A0AAW2MMN4_9LAMI